MTGIPQDQVEAVSRAIASGLSFDAPTTKIAEEVIRVLTPMIAAVERERCAALCDDKQKLLTLSADRTAQLPCRDRRDEDDFHRIEQGFRSRAMVAQGLAESIRSVKGAVT